MDKKERKSLGYNFLLDILYVVVISISYNLTIDILKNVEVSNTQISFLRGAFVFIAPCAMEGIDILTARAKSNPWQDRIEVGLSIGAIAITVFLVIILFFGRSDGVQIVRWVIIIYPVRFFSNVIFDLLCLIKGRRRSE